MLRKFRKSSGRVTLVLIGLTTLAGCAEDDARRDVYKTREDCLADVRATEVRYDLESMDLTDPEGPSVELYSPATFGLVKGALAAGGALTLHIGSPFSHAARVRSTLANLREVFPLVTTYFVHIPLYGSIWGFACASSTLDPRAIAPQEVERRLAARGIADLQYYNGEVHRAIFALPNYIRELVR